MKLLDFGLAKARETEPCASALANSPPTFAATRAGVILGTVAYMALEQAKGKTLDRRADIWSFPMLGQGRKLGPYEILSPLGMGGRGQFIGPAWERIERRSGASFGSGEATNGNAGFLAH